MQKATTLLTKKARSGSHTSARASGSAYSTANAAEPHFGCHALRRGICSLLVNPSLSLTMQATASAVAVLNRAGADRCHALNRRIEKHSLFNAARAPTRRYLAGSNCQNRHADCMPLQDILTLCSRNIIIIAKKSNSYLSPFLDPHPDSPLVLSAYLEAPADTDLVQGPEVQVQPDFREPPRCSSRCQQAARATAQHTAARTQGSLTPSPRVLVVLA